MKTALITGINGQDGSYLSEFLLEKGYEVWGTLKRNSITESQTSRLFDISKIKLEYADMLDMSSLIRVLQLCQPDEIYNLAAQSDVRISFDQPIYTTQTIAIGTLNLLEAIRLTCQETKMYQASSSEMFGNNIDDDGFQRETTPMSPVSPYGCAKVYAYNICRNYRNAYNIFISNGILFNHESPRRGTNFVTNKVCREAVKIKLGLSNELKLGNLEASRDWGHAKDYIKAMWLMLQQDSSDDFICSGRYIRVFVLPLASDFNDPSLTQHFGITISGSSNSFPNNLALNHLPPSFANNLAPIPVCLTCISPSPPSCGFGIPSLLETFGLFAVSQAIIL